MHTYEVQRNGIQFKVYVNDKIEPEVNIFDELPTCEVMMDSIIHTITYGGRDPFTDCYIVMFDHDKAVFAAPDEDVNDLFCMKTFAEFHHKDLYQITTSAGRVFYEACSDMKEKKDLYKEIGAKSERIYRYQPEKEKIPR
jgi:hypothetical protein